MKKEIICILYVSDNRLAHEVSLDGLDSKNLHYGYCNEMKFLSPRKHFYLTILTYIIREEKKLLK